MQDNHYRKIEIPSCFKEAKKLEDTIVDEAQSHGYDEESLFAVRLSLEEAFANAVRHGNSRNPTKKVRVKYRVDNEQVDIYIEDDGNGFDPKKVPDPTTEKNLEIPTGRGIMLMRAYMNVVEYNENGNGVRLVRLNQQN